MIKIGSSIEARNIIKDLLNANILDPYTGTRPGVNPQHFYDQTDELNLTRGNSFPKGYITSRDPKTTPDGYGPSGHNMREITIDIWYFVKSDISYNDGSITYKEEDYAEYMTNLISKYLMNTRNLGSDYHLKTMNQGEGPKNNTEGSIKVYYDLVSITVYWNEK